MEHYIFLIQIISLILSFTVMIILLQRGYVLFAVYTLLMIFRTGIFALVRYGNLSRFFIFPQFFNDRALAGLIYALLVYFSHFFLFRGLYKQDNRRTSLPLSFAFVLVSLYSLILYVMILLEIDLSRIPCDLLSVTSLSVIPILTVKVIIFIGGIHLIFKRDKKRDYILFIFLLSLGILSDGIFFAYDFVRPVTILTAVFLPPLSFLFLLPKSKELSSSTLPIEELSTTYSLTEEETSLVMLISQGMSNKEIAFEWQISLSKVKHKIHILYKKCGIHSRWELISMLHVESRQTIE